MSTGVQPPGDQLDLISRVAQAFNSSLDLSEVLERVMDEVIAASQAERGFVMLRDDTGSLRFQTARGMASQTIQAPQFQVSRGVVERVVQTGQPILATDAATDAWLSQRASVVGLGLRSILCVPLQLKNTTIGVVYVDNHVRAGVFNERQLELLTALAHQAAIAIDNARLFESLQTKLRTLDTIRQISADLTATLNLDHVLTLCLQRVQQLLGSATSSVLLVDGEELVFRIALGERAEQVKPFRIPRGQGIAGWVVQHKQTVVSNDVQNDDRFYRGVDRHSGFVTRSLAAAPLLINDRATGVIEVANKPGGFSPADVDLLATIASSAAIAIENARLYDLAVEKGRMERELQVARDVQQRLIPTSLPTVPGWDFAALWRPAREVSGDFYDIILARGKLGLIIADVSDKGIGAALFMALTRSTLRASFTLQAAPARSMAHANRLICADAPDGMFVTLVAAQLDPASAGLRYVNAGHNPPLIYHAAGNAWTELPSTGVALGIDDRLTYAEREETLAIGDMLLMYTDGVTEAQTLNGELFGVERLLNVLSAQQERSAQETLAAVGEAIHRFTGGGLPSDDITMLAVKRLPPA